MIFLISRSNLNCLVICFLLISTNLVFAIESSKTLNPDLCQTTVEGSSPSNLTKFKNLLIQWIKSHPTEEQISQAKKALLHQENPFSQATSTVHTQLKGAFDLLLKKEPMVDWSNLTDAFDQLIENETATKKKVKEIDRKSISKIGFK